jgi:prepilin-type N-terminal cleavage/methylation domain-containing protein
MNSDRGFTLVEMMISMIIILIVSLGFFGWAAMVTSSNINAQKNNTAYAMAKDIGESLQGLDKNDPLILPKSGNEKRIGYNSDGELRKCSSGLITSNLVTSDAAGTTEFTNVWKSATSKLYLYDKNSCVNKTWADSGCGDSGTMTIDTTANTNIDHPNAEGSAYDTINPVRFYQNTTFYAVWSIAYIPCTGDINKRKIFVTIYWVDPEPVDSAIADVQTKIAAGTAVLKHVSLVIDKSTGTE